MSILFVGDLQLKYLHHVLEDDSSARFSSGFLVEQIMALLSGVVLDVRTITIHVRTNNIPHEDPITKKYLEGQPQREHHRIRYSTPRCNCFEEARNNVGFIDSCNGKSREINVGLNQLAATTPLLEFSQHPAFGVDRLTDNRHLLSLDGLHLTFQGIQQLKDDICVMCLILMCVMCPVSLCVMCHIGLYRVLWENN